MSEKQVDMQQIQQLWSMLDEMSSSDPQAYKNFISKQLKEGKEATELERPQFNMAIQSTYNNDSSCLIFINIYGWLKIPAPECQSDSIPICDGVIMDFEDFPNKRVNEEGKLVSVGVHPRVLQEYGHESPSSHRDILVNLILESLQTLHNIIISRHYVITASCAGKEEKALKSLMMSFYKQKPHKKDERHNNTDLYKDVINLSKTKSSDSTETTLENTELVLKTDCKTDGTCKVLIEEMNEGDCESIIKTPVHKQRVFERKGCESLQVKIWLPGVESVDKCYLEISEDDLLVEANNEYFLVASLLCKIQCENVEASFDNAKSCLTMLMPCFK